MKSTFAVMPNYLFSQFEGRHNMRAMVYPQPGLSAKEGA